MATILRSRLYPALVTLILLFTLPATAQKKGEALADSLKKAWPTQKSDSARLDVYIRICRAYRYAAPDSLMHFAQEAMPLAKKVGTPQQINRLYANMGISECRKVIIKRQRPGTTVLMISQKSPGTKRSSDLPSLA